MLVFVLKSTVIYNCYAVWLVFTLKCSTGMEIISFLLTSDSECKCIDERNNLKELKKYNTRADFAESLLASRRAKYYLYLIIIIISRRINVF